MLIVDHFMIILATFCHELSGNTFIQSFVALKVSTWLLWDRKNIYPTIYTP